MSAIEVAKRPHKIVEMCRHYHGPHLVLREELQQRARERSEDVLHVGANGVKVLGREGGCEGQIGAPEEVVDTFDEARMRVLRVFQGRLGEAGLLEANLAICAGNG